MTNRHALADTIVRAGTVHLMDAAGSTAAEIAIRAGTVLAVGARPGDLDPLIGPATRVLGGPDVTVLPAFVDTHNHLTLAARNTFGVPVSGARGIADVLAAIRTRAERTPPGEWVVTAGDWHEVRLAERRLPTAAELDTATSDHPVLVLRGVHNGALNTAGLRAAGLAPQEGARPPTGRVGGPTLERAMRALGPVSPETQARGLAEASAHYASLGIGTIRDPGVRPADWAPYRLAHQAGQLSVRSHVMFSCSPADIASAGSTEAFLDGLEELGLRPSSTGPGPCIWGLKVFLDGGVETAALVGHYAGRPDYHGTLVWEPDAVAELLATTVRRGWPVGVHAFGDQAVKILLAAARQVREQHGPWPEGTLVIEHGGLIGAQLAEAAALGLHVTVQQPLLDGLDEALIDAWGCERTAELFPLRGLLDAGVPISAGTDHPVGPLHPLRAVHGMVTRRTEAGILGQAHAITRVEALRLATAAGAALLGGPAPLTVGAPADLAGYPIDPLVCPVDLLPDTDPAFTLVGGRLVHGINVFA